MTARRLVLLSVLLLAALTGAAWARDRYPLSGEWRARAGEEEAPPALDDPAWEPVTLPSVATCAAEGPHAVWYHTHFALPFSWSGYHLVLRLEGAKFAQRVFLNGREVGRHLGGFEPVEYDVSAFVTPGKRADLLIRLQDATALFPAAQKSAGAPGSAAPPASAGMVSPAGGAPEEVGIWDRVWLERRPRVSLGEVRVLPSFRKNTLQVVATVRSLASAEAAKKADRPADFDQTATVTASIPGLNSVSFDPATVTLAPGEEKTVTLNARGEAPEAWWPSRPRLHTLRVAVKAGWQAEAVEVKFGFRDVAVEGDRLLLNGVPIRLLAVSLAEGYLTLDPATVYQALKAYGVNAVWLANQPWPESWYEAADAAGMLVIADSALAGPAESYRFGPELFEASRAQVRAMAQHLANHPSIVAWNAETGMSTGSRGGVPPMPMLSLADAIRGADTSRPVLFAGEGDLGGRADIVSLRPRAPFELLARPESSVWSEAAGTAASASDAPRRGPGGKPIALAGFPALSPDEVNMPSLLFGDAYYPHMERYLPLAEAALRRWQVLAAREAGVSIICAAAAQDLLGPSTPLSQSLAAAFRPVTAFDLSPNQSVFAGSVAERRVAVLNDSPIARHLSLRWSLAPASGGGGIAGQMPLEMEAAGHEVVTIDLPLPVLSAPITEADATLELWEGERQLCQEAGKWRIFGRAALSGRLAEAPRRVAVYDPAGGMAALLADTGLDATRIEPADPAAALRRASLAVVGEGAFEEKAGAGGVPAALEQFVREGGALVVLAQHALPSWLPVSLAPQRASLAFVRDASHPVLKALDDRDFAYWLPDGLLSSKQVVKPVWGGFRTLVDSGGAEGLATAVLGELRLGKGKVILCQLETLARYGVDPSATRLVRNLLSYAVGPVPAGRPLALVCDDATAAAIAATGADSHRLTTLSGGAALNGSQALLVSDFLAVRGHEAELQAFVRRGGSVVLHGVDPSNVEIVTRLIEGPVTVGDNDQGAFAGVNFAGPALGMSNEELAWITWDAEGVALSPRVATYVVDLPSVPKAAAHTDPHVLISISSGRGTWIIDQVRWEDAGEQKMKAGRYLATLLQNLGVSFSALPPPAPAAPPALPKAPAASPTPAPAPAVTKPAPPPAPAHVPAAPAPAPTPPATPPAAPVASSGTPASPPATPPAAPAVPPPAPGPPSLPPVPAPPTAPKAP